MPNPSADLRSILAAFGKWEALALEYKTLITNAATDGGAVNWTQVCELIDQMTEARDAWLDISQSFLEQVPSGTRSSAQAEPG